MGKGLKFWIFEVLPWLVVLGIEIVGLIYVLTKIF